MNETDLLAAEKLAMYQLSLVEGLGPIKLGRLLERFGSAQQILGLSASQLRQVDGIGAALAAEILRSEHAESAQQGLAEMGERGVRLLIASDPEFPPVLREVVGGPLLLTMRGTLCESDQMAVAIVGSRRCTAYGRKIAALLAAGLAQRGVTVVSGLARGIDGAAHQAALDAGGRTLAVLASGLARIYPPEHHELAVAVSAQGALISEAPLHGPPIGELFPRRNRIISGLSLAVVVVEAADRSGALSTAHHALEQGRDVFAVPGRIGDLASEGTNRLIQQGAALVTSADDILERIGPVAATSAAAIPEKKVVLPPLTDQEKLLYETLGNDSVEMETLLERTGLAAGAASAALLTLEMKRLVHRQPGNRYART